MGYKQLFIWVEGPDDVRFFEQIIKPIFDKSYDWVVVRAYAKKQSKYITRFVKSIKAMPADYIFVADINLAPCITDKKQRLQKTFKNIKAERTVIVVKEIESWYLVGLNEVNSKKLGLPPFDVTDNVEKEKFNQLIPKKFDSRVDFMLEILKHFSTATAKQKNNSFKYFVEKYISVQ